MLLLSRRETEDGGKIAIDIIQSVFTEIKSEGCSRMHARFPRALKLHIIIGLSLTYVYTGTE